MITPIQYVGSKAKLARLLVPMIPRHKSYVEVFGGSGALLFTKSPSRFEVYNDINKHLVTLFRVIRDEDKSRELYTMLVGTMYSREEHDLAARMLFENSYADDVEHAWATFVKYNQSFGGIGLDDKGSWSFGKGHPTGAYWNRVDDIEKMAKRLRTVQIENDTWQEIIKRYDDKETFFYLDPPYLLSEREGGAAYLDEMTTEQHEELILYLIDLKGKAFLSGYDNTHYDYLLKGDWGKMEFEVKSSMRVDGKMVDRTEVVWHRPKQLSANDATQGVLFTLD